MANPKSPKPPWVRAGINIQADAADQVAKLIELFCDPDHNAYVVQTVKR